MQYARAIRIARAARGLSQKELAREAGLDPSYISLLEKGARAPRPAAVEALSSALQVPVELLTLLAAGQDDVIGLTRRRAEALGREMLRLLVEISDKRPVKRGSL